MMALLLAFLGGAALGALIWPPIPTPTPRLGALPRAARRLRSPRPPSLEQLAQLARRMARELRRGRSLLAAIQAAQGEAPPSLRSRLQAIEEDFSTGLSVAQALRRQRHGLPASNPLAPLLSLLIVAEERGLAPETLCLRLTRTAQSLAARQRLEAEARAATAATRSSQVVVALIVPFVLAATLLQNPEMRRFLLHTGLGHGLLLAVAFLETLAVVLGRLVTRVPEL